MALECPCCRQSTNAPTVDALILSLDLQPLQSRILRAVWFGKGMPVQTKRIFDHMYIDDPDGGPSSARMYAALKVGLCRLRKRLEGSGVSIETSGYRKGYRLVLSEHEKAAA